ncbi:short-chain collagen C4-like [Argonauta hians]
MEVSKISRNISQRFSIATLVTFGLFIVLTVTILHQDSRIRKIEQRPESGHKLFKKSLESKLKEEPKTKSSNAGVGAMYTRWGRKVCPSSAHLVYKGVVAGTHYDTTGGGSNLLCLPTDPIWANFTTEIETTSHIHGSEYELTSHATKIFDYSNSKTLHDHNVPCAVCLTKEPTVVMMLPGRTKCYRDWSVEYSGYLMTENAVHKGRHEYVCVDKAPEADPAGYRNENGALLYFVQASCGSLPCPPYVDGQELTCAVCSKN